MTTETVKVLWWAGKGPFAEAIKYCTNGPWSHCAVVVRDELYESRIGDGVVLDGDASSVMARVSGADAVGEIDVNLSSVRLMREWLFAQQGRPYDLKAITRYALRLRWPAKGSGDDSMFCSELVHLAFVHGSVRVLCDLVPSERVDPYLLYCSPEWRLAK